jgi:hypothetical protein
VTRSCRDLLIEVIAANSVVHTKAWMDEAAEAVENERRVLSDILKPCLDPEEPPNAATAPNTASSEPKPNEQWTTAKQPAGAADTPSPQNNPGTSATTTTTGPATRDQNTNTATGQQEQPKATPNPQPRQPAPTPPPGGNDYTCGTCGSTGLILQGRFYPNTWLITCLNGHPLTADPATTYTIYPGKA